MGIPDPIIEEVRQRGDLVEIVAAHTRLKRSGKDFRGPCPLHRGEGPNFSVDPVKQVFHCFTCKEGGDIFSFPMKMMGLGFSDAVRHVAERAGVEIPEAEIRRKDDPFDAYYAANAFAADWFRRQLRDPQEGAAAREYLAKRGVPESAIERFGLGWAPDSWSALSEAARRHGIAPDLLVDLGLLKVSEKEGREPYDTFRGRLIFPIEDLGSRIIAFGGRLIAKGDGNAPKYLNSPESKVFQKGESLYGLRWSRGMIRKADEALVVEGYMDYVMLASHGVEHVVAPLGTALTERQADLLSRYASRAVLLYDSDSAGLKATFRAGDELLRAGMEVTVASLPAGEDPDSVVRTGGTRVLKRLVKGATDILERKIEELEKRDYFDSGAGIRRAVDALIPTVQATSDQVLREVYVGRIAERTRLSRERIEMEADKEAPRGRRSGPGGEVRVRESHNPAPPAPAPRVTSMLGPERNLLLLMIRDENWVERVLCHVGPADFEDHRCRVIFEHLVSIEGGRDLEGGWVEECPEEIRDLVRSLVHSPEMKGMGDPNEFFDVNLQRIVARAFEAQLRQVREEMQTAGEDRQTELLIEQQRLQNEMRSRGIVLKPGLWRRAS